MEVEQQSRGKDQSIDFPKKKKAKEKEETKVVAQIGPKKEEERRMACETGRSES
jgi:hypothetical protein